MERKVTEIRKIKSFYKRLRFEDLNRLEERDLNFAFKMRGIPDEKVVELLWDKYSISLHAENYYSMPEVYDILTMMLASLVHHNTIKRFTFC